MDVILKDKYLEVRGGESKILELSCYDCGGYLCRYQKDGPGPLLRLYEDRIRGAGLEGNDPVVDCDKCGNQVGMKYIYEKEKRPAIKLFVGGIEKIEDD